MRRRHLVELEDLEWFPATIRDLGTDYLRFVSTMLYSFTSLEERVAEVMRGRGVDAIVDLCSGGGGPLWRFAQGIETQGVALRRVTMTDKYPNAEAFAYAVAQSGGRVAIESEPVDATRVPEHLAGLRTIFNAFHHFPPQLARSILQDAVDQRQPIAVFEMVERRLAPGALLFGGLFAALAAPFVRPFKWSRLVYSWLLPVVPALVMWDGFVSCLRVYEPAELDELIASLSNTAGYRFETGIVAESRAKPRVTYLLGWPDDQE